jgi:ubiquinone/menaquinone biosynthesis C-methylase UbiE
MISSSEYLVAQKAFWDVHERLARFGRVDTLSTSEIEYEARAERDFARVFAGLEHRIEAQSTVLEIGCGVGRLLSRLLAYTTPKLVIGLDISAGMIEQARNALGPREDLILLTNSGADLQMIANESVDLAFCNDVFIHVHDIGVIRQYLDETRRVLKPSGVFRFNVRRMQLARMFSNTPGGLLAKLSYSMGFRSPLRRSENPVAGFDGLHYRARDMTRMVRSSGFKIARLAVHEGEGADGERYWCTCQRK